MPVVESLEAGKSVGRGAHVITARLQSRAQHARELRLVVNYEDTCSIRHCVSTVAAEYRGSSITSSSPVGNVNNTRVPFPLRPDSIQMLPSCASTNPFAIAR